MDLVLAEQLIRSSEISEQLKRVATDIVQGAQRRGYLEDAEQDMLMKILDKEALNLEKLAEQNENIAEALDSYINELDISELLSE